MSVELPITIQDRILYKWNFDPNDLQKSKPSDGKLPKIRKVGTADPVPFGLKVYKGRKSWQLPHSFVEFILHHPVAIAFEGKHLLLLTHTKKLISKNGQSSC